MRNETRIGLFLMAIYGLLNTVFSAPELLKGSVIGISIAFICIGLLPDNNYNRLKLFKKRNK
ncbi:MAG: hypothetical protein GX288_01080 [Clostridiales bacterium]|nr:hypothetical protein [Clostridiales bacterium]